MFPDYSSELPVVIDVNGTPLYFEIKVDEFSWSPISSIRDAVDQNAEAGEQSIVRTGLWKRTRGNWTLGENQDYGDEPGDSEELQYYQSRGINPWDQRKLFLLNDVEQKRTTANTTGKLVAVDDRVYWLDGTTLRYDTTPEGSGGFTSVVAGTFTDITQYGNKLVAARGIDVRIIDNATNNAFSSADADYVLYGNGRLIGMHDNELFELDSVGAKATLFTHPNISFVWKGGVSASNGIYVFGTAGLTSEIYFIGIDDATTSLFAPYTAAPLVPNEEVHCLYYYGGVIVIGTERGFRLANITGNGHLSYGPLIEVGPVKQFAGDGEDLWFTWTNYDGSYTGLGRTRLDRGTDVLVPRYASDVMAAAQGTVLAACTFESRQYFVVSGNGLYGTIDNKVATGWLNSGWITYGTSELKEMHSLDVRHEPLPAGSSVTGKLVKEDLTKTTVVTSTATNAVGKIADVSPKFTTEQIQIEIELARATNATVSPEFRRWTLRAVPMPFKQSVFILPLLFTSVVEMGRGQRVRQNTLNQWNALRALEAARTLIQVKIGDVSVDCRVDGVGIQPGGVHSWSNNAKWFEGVVMVRFETAETIGS